MVAVVDLVRVHDLDRSNGSCNIIRNVKGESPSSLKWIIQYSNALTYDRNKRASNLIGPIAHTVRSFF